LQGNLSDPRIPSRHPYQNTGQGHLSRRLRSSIKDWHAVASSVGHGAATWEVSPFDGLTYREAIYPDHSPGARTSMVFANYSGPALPAWLFVHKHVIESIGPSRLTMLYPVLSQASSSLAWWSDGAAEERADPIGRLCHCCRSPQTGSSSNVGEGSGGSVRSKAMEFVAPCECLFEPDRIQIAI
jgi:hypothetical protein